MYRIMQHVQKPIPSLEELGSLHYLLFPCYSMVLSRMPAQNDGDNMQGLTASWGHAIYCYRNIWHKLDQGSPLLCRYLISTALTIALPPFVSYLTKLPHSAGKLLVPERRSLRKMRPPQPVQTIMDCLERNDASPPHWEHL